MIIPRLHAFRRSRQDPRPSRLMAASWIAALVIGCGLAAIPARADLKPASSTPIEGDRELGEYLAAECMTCHQASGRQDGIPSIIGLDPARFIEVLKAYRAHERDNMVMRTVAAKFSDEELAALAVYFASLKPTP